MSRSRLVRVPRSGYMVPDDDTTDWRQDGDHTDLDHKGAGDALFLLGGWSPEGAHPYNGIARSYAHFPLTSEINAAFPGLGWAGVKTIRLAYISFSTRYKEGPTGTPSYPYNASYFVTGSEAKVRIHRLTRDAVYNSNGDGLIDDPADPPPAGRWSSADDSNITSSDWVDRHFDEFVSPNDKGETRIICTQLVGEWAPGSAGGHDLHYHSPDTGALVQCGDPDDHTARANHGVVIKAPSEQSSGGDQRFEFYSSRSDVLDRYKPHLSLIVEPYGATPLAPRLIEPNNDEVNPDQDFEGYIEEDSEDPVTSIELQVNDDYGGDGQTIWNPTAPRSLAWPDSRFLIESPRTFAKDSPHSWRARQRTATTPTPGPWSGWRDFTIARETPTVTPQPLGAQVQLLGTHLRASFVTP